MLFEPPVYIFMLWQLELRQGAYGKNEKTDKKAKGTWVGEWFIDG